MAVLAENDKAETQRALQNAMAGQKVPNLRAYFLAGKDSRLALFDQAGTLHTSALWQTVHAAVQTRKPALLILDNLMHLFGGNEIDKTQAVQFIRLLRAACSELQTTILLLAHPSLSGKQSGSGTSGSMAWSDISSIKRRTEVILPFW